MPLNYGDLKDKYIRHEGTMYRPYIHIFGELDPIPLDLCESIVIAQKILSKYPSDCFEGALLGEKRSRGKVDKQVDRAYNIKYRKKTRRSRRRKTSRYCGRSFGRRHVVGI